MDKSEDAFRTISEAAEELDLPQHVLRFWETRFPQIRPLKRGGGRRYYRPDDVELLRAIRHLLYSDGYTIKGVQRMLKERGAREVLSMPRESAGSVVEARLIPPSRVEPPPSETWDVPVDTFPTDAGEFEKAPVDFDSAPARSPVVTPGLLSSQGVSMPPQRMAPPWTSEQYRKLSAIVGELAECRRILSAANS